MSHSFDSADRRTHVKIIFAALVLCSAVALLCLSLGSGSNIDPRTSGKQVVRAKAPSMSATPARTLSVKALRTTVVEGCSPGQAFCEYDKAGLD